MRLKSILTGFASLAALTIGAQAQTALSGKVSSQKEGAVCACAPMVSAARDRKSTRLNSSHVSESRMPSSA